MSLTPVIADAFLLEDLTQAPARYPSFTVMVLRMRHETETRFRGVVSDGKFGFTIIINSGSVVGAESMNSGDVIEITKYSLHFVNTSREKPSSMHPILRVYAFETRGRQDLPAKSPPKFNDESLVSYKASKSGAAPVTAAPLPSPAVAESAKRSHAASSASVAPPSKRQKVKTQPIESVFPLASHWTIRARASRKGPLRSYKNERKEGKLFSVTFLDESGEIRATAFGEEAEKFHGLIQDGHMYYVSNARVEPAKKNFNNVKNEYEMFLRRDTIVDPCEEDDSTIPEVSYDFCDIEKLQEVENGSYADVIGVVQNVAEVSKITSRNTGRPYDKREVSLVDRTGLSVDVTLWGQEAVDFSGRVADIVAIKGARTGAFNSRKTLSTMSSSLVSVNPNIKEAHALKGWYDAQGHDQNFKPLEAETVAPGSAQNEIKLIQQVFDERLGTSGSVDYFTIQATTIRVFSRGLVYPACTTDGCQKKVTQETTGEWSCEKCGSHMSEPNYRYTSTILVGDGLNSEGMRLSFFDETARVIFGRPAKEVAEMQDNESALLNYLKDLSGQEFTIRCRAKLDTYNGNEAVRYQAVSLKSVKEDLDKDTARLLEDMGL